MSTIMTTDSTMPVNGRSQRRIGDVVIHSEPHIIRAVVDRPTQRNAISTSVIDGLEHAVRLATATAASVLVISGAASTFCSGADLRELAELRTDPDLVKRFMARLGTVLDALENGTFASVAVVDGYAVAGGCEILLACDVSVAAHDARIGDRHVEYGLAPAAGGSVRLVRGLPRAQANYLLLTGDLISGRTAADWGLVTRAVEATDLWSEAERVIERLASRSQDAVRTVKAMIRAARHSPNEEALYRERELFLQHMASADVAEGLAAFQQRRPPTFNRQG